MAAYGNTRIRVPAINRLASQSVVFDRTYVTQPVCTPSRSSVMTGLWPHQSGCVRNNVPMKAETKTTPNCWAFLLPHGYMGKWHLGDEIYAQHGFEEWKAMEDGYRRSSPPRATGTSAAPIIILVRWATSRPGERFQPELRHQAASRALETLFLQRGSNFVLQHRAGAMDAVCQFPRARTCRSQAC